jgi:hypothetical protein
MEAFFYIQDSYVLLFNVVIRSLKFGNVSFAKG